jgi:ABC-2 type transport system permease protein
MNRTISIALKGGKELFRDPRALFFMLMFPVIFMLVFGAAFSTSFIGNTTYKIAVVNQDSGIADFPTRGNTSYLGNEFVKVLKDMRYTDKDGKKKEAVFSLNTGLSEKDADAALKSGDIDAVLRIPSNFSAALAAELQNYIDSHFPRYNGTPMGGFPANYSAVDPNVTSQLVISGDKGRQGYYTSYSIVMGVFNAYKEMAKSISLSEVNRAMEQQGLMLSLVEARQNVLLSESPIAGTSSLTGFDYMAPGFMVFGILMGGSGVIASLAEEKENETLKRLKISKMRSSDLMIGTLIPYAIMGFVQVMLSLVVALLVGYHYNPNGNLALAGLIGMLGGVATVALGLIVAAFISNAKQGGSLGAMITVPLSFLSGAFFPLPNPTLIPDFFGKGQHFGIWDVLPWRQCSSSLTKVLTFGAGIEGVASEVGLMIVEILVLLGLGVYLYRSKQLKAE